MASLSFAVIADKNYKDAFNAMARQKGRTMAELVREALDAKYGAEMERYLSFFEPDGASKNQTDTEKTTHA